MNVGNKRLREEFDEFAQLLGDDDDDGNDMV